MTVTRNVCGVCTDHNFERSTVREMILPSAVSLMVSVTGCAATAAPVSRAATMVAAINSALVQGRAASWMATISVLGESAASPFQTESCRAADDEAERFLKMEFPRELHEMRLHPVTHNEDDFVHASRVVELPPGVRNDRPAGDFEPELVHVRAHARALAGGNNDGGNHADEV